MTLCSVEEHLPLGGPVSSSLSSQTRFSITSSRAVSQQSSQHKSWRKVFRKSKLATFTNLVSFAYNFLVAFSFAVFHRQISHCTAPPAGTFSCHACSCSQLTIFIWKSSIMLREQVVILHVILQTAKLPLIKTNHKVFFNLKKIPLVEWGRSYPPHSLNTLVLPTVLRRFLSFSFYTLVILFSYR